MKIQFIGVPLFQKQAGEYADQWEAISEKAITAFMAETGLVFKKSEYTFHITDLQSNQQAYPHELRLPATVTRGSRMGMLLRALALIVLEENHVSHSNMDQDGLANLFLYDVMIVALGSRIADSQVISDIEQGYSLWNYALARSALERYKLMSRIVRDSRRSPAAV